MLIPSALTLNRIYKMFVDFSEEAYKRERLIRMPRVFADGLIAEMVNEDGGSANAVILKTLRPLSDIRITEGTLRYSGDQYWLTIQFYYGPNLPNLQGEATGRIFIEQSTGSSLVSGVGYKEWPMSDAWGIGGVANIQFPVPANYYFWAFVGTSTEIASWSWRSLEGSFDQVPEVPLELSGSIASGSPTMSGDLILDGPLPLSGSIASGAPTMSGDLTANIPDQVLNLPAPTTVGSDYLEWIGLGLLLEPLLTIDQDTNIYLIVLRLHESGENRFFVSNVQGATIIQSFLTGREMIPVWEQNLSAIRLQFGGLSAYIPGPDSSESTTQDDTEPYNWTNNGVSVNDDLADIIDSVANGDAGNLILTLSSEYTEPPLPPLELSGSIASGAPTMEGDLTIVNPLQLSGSIASGSPTMRGDLSVLPAIQLSGSIDSGAPTMEGDLSVSEPLAPSELSGSMASGSPTMEGDLSLKSPLLLLSHWDSSGLIVDAAAVLVSTGFPELYANSDRGGTGVPLEGELGLSATQTEISRIRWNGSNLILNDNNVPSALTLSDYLILAANNFHIYLQTALDGVVSFRIADNLPGSAQGGNFINITPPQDASDLLDNISDGDRFLFAVASPAPIGLSGDMSSGSPTMGGDLSVVNPLQLSGDMASGSPTMRGDLSVLPAIQLSGSIDSGAPTMDGDLSVKVVAPFSLSGSIASGSPTMEGDLTVPEPLLLSGDMSSGSPTMEGDLSIGPVTSINPPTNLVVTTPNDGQIHLSWDWNQGEYPDDNLVGLRFQIQYKRNKETRWTEDGTVEYGRKEHTIVGLATSQFYQWRLRAVSLLGDGYISPWVSGEKETSGSPLELIVPQSFDNFTESSLKRTNGRVVRFPRIFADDIIGELVSPSDETNGALFILKTLRPLSDIRITEGTLRYSGDQYWLTIQFYYGPNLPNLQGEATGRIFIEQSTGSSLVSGVGYKEWPMSDAWGIGGVANIQFPVPANYYFWAFVGTSTEIASWSWRSLEGSFDQVYELTSTETETNITEIPYNIFSELEEEDESDNRPGSHAKYFTFTLTETKTVTIDMEGNNMDPYLYLLQGQRGGSVIEENDDIDASANDYDSRITRELVAGTYTVEATSHGAGSLGTFILRVED